MLKRIGNRRYRKICCGPLSSITYRARRYWTSTPHRIFSRSLISPATVNGRQSFI